MFIDQYYNEDNGKVTFSRQQGSDFAKNVADDFNPLHDWDAKRFCIPGDLLFSLVLSKYGINQHMTFTFSDMVTEDVTLNLPPSTPRFSLVDDNGREYLDIEHSGDNSTNSTLIDNLTRAYVEFSGHTFPHILMPLMEENGVMINRDRPLVIYQNMVIDLDRLDLHDISLELDREKTVMTVNGKRGNVSLAFNILAGGHCVGRGEKHMVVSGLKPFDKAVVDTVISEYREWKTNYKG